MKNEATMHLEACPLLFLKRFFGFKLFLGLGGREVGEVKPGNLRKGMCNP